MKPVWKPRVAIFVTTRLAPPPAPPASTSPCSFVKLPQTIMADRQKTIFDQNILGGTCARVCPTETLCEQACVRNDAEGNPVKIGRLQRYSTDFLMAQPKHPYERGPETGSRFAVVGAGPAGLACAHRLAMYGHNVRIFDARPKPGGLNEYGIAAY